MGTAAAGTAPTPLSGWRVWPNYYFPALMLGDWEQFDYLCALHDFMGMVGTVEVRE
jgi:hypothetical protein